MTGKCKLDNRVIKLSEKCRDCKVGGDLTLGGKGMEKKKTKKEGWLKRAFS